MCLAVPMRVVSIDRLAASCEARGIRRDVSLFLLPDGSVGVGEYVLVHLGYAIHALSQPEAAASPDLCAIITPGQDPQALRPASP